MPTRIAVPQQAIQRNAGGGSEVFVVKDDNRVAVQPVRTGSQQDGQWLVLDGLKPGRPRGGRRLPEIRAGRCGQAGAGARPSARHRPLAQPTLTRPVQAR